MKKIVYIRATGIFDDSRATKEIKSLLSFGYYVVVLCWDRYGDAYNKNREVFFGDNNIEFHYFKKIVPNGIGMKNIFKLVLWFKWVKRELKKQKGLYLVHACNLDAGLSAYAFCTKRPGIKFVYDIYDYYVDSHSIPRFLRRKVEGKEIRIINKSDATIICTEERIKQISLSEPKRIEVIHNSPNVDLIVNEQTEYDYVYCGALCSKRLIEEILFNYPNHKELVFYFAGYGEYSTLCKAMADEYENFHYSGPLPYNEVLAIESKAMALSAIYEPTIRNHVLCAPNKFYEAMALSKPVIVCGGTGIDKIVSNNNTGIVIDYSAESFYQALTKLKNNSAESFKMGMAGRKLYESEYKWSLMNDKLKKLYEDLIGSCV